MSAVVVESLLASPALAFIEGIGAMEMMLVAVIGLLLFGGKGLPDMARTFGKIVREFKKASSSVEAEVKRVMNEEPEDSPPPPRPRRTAHASLPPAEAAPTAEKQNDARADDDVPPTPRVPPSPGSAA